LTKVTKLRPVHQKAGEVAKTPWDHKRKVVRNGRFSKSNFLSGV
jgi:hypothetical protein